MPSAAGYTWTDENDAIIRREAHGAGVPLAWAYAFIASECGFNFAARNESNIEHSYGALQLNRDGGQGTGYPVESLLDLATNLRIGLPYIARALLTVPATESNLHEIVYLVSTRSGHPGQVARDDERIARIYGNFTAFYAAFPEPFPDPPPAPSVPPSGVLQTQLAIKGLVAATFVLSIGRPLSDLSAEDRTAVRYVAANL